MVLVLALILRQPALMSMVRLRAESNASVIHKF